MADYNKYQNGKIYKLTNNVNNDIYIGSTIKTLSIRFSKHKNDYRRFLSGKNYTNFTSFKLFDKYGIENCFIELIELYPCENRKEISKQEGYYINENRENCVNKNIAGRTLKQYLEIKNKCNCGGKFTNRNKNKHLKTKKHKDYLRNNTTYITDNNKVKINIYNELTVF